MVDPDEAAARLPDGVRPHVTARGTVVGCCLLDIEEIRPSGVPARLGWRMRATADRISAAWEDATGTTVTGVYVPDRYTDARLAALVGGRWFPGVHRRARVDVGGPPSPLHWRCEPLDARGAGIRVSASPEAGASPGPACDVVGATCLGASVGVSPDRRGRLEAARMSPSHQHATAMRVEDLDAPFLDGFSTARLSTSYLMVDAEVTWTRAATPVTAGAVAPVRISGSPVIDR